jgi:hypothetical protein
MSGISIDSPSVEAIRSALGGQLSPLPITNLRWYLKDLETALHQADEGVLDKVGQLWRAMRRDAVLVGTLSTLVDGVAALPRRWTGDEEAVRLLEGRDGVTSVFDALCPIAEQAMMIADAVGCGVAVGELRPVAGRDYPVLIRLDPQWLVYRWNENRWYYNSIAGLLPITPGDGRWVLHIDKARTAPWSFGLWYPLGQSWINKQHAMLYKSNWEAKLANPARAAVSPQGAGEKQKEAWFRQVMAWGVNTVFGMTPGYDVKLLESNGRGYDSFSQTIAQSDREYAIALTGQTVTTDGGKGFSNEETPRQVRADIIKGRADAWAHTVNTQVVPPFIAVRLGVDRLSRSPALELDARPPKNLKDSANVTLAFGQALIAANAALAPYGIRVDAREMASQFGIPLEQTEAVGTVSAYFDDNGPGNDVAVDDQAEAPAESSPAIDDEEAFDAAA